MAMIIGIAALAVIFVLGLGLSLASGAWSRGKKTTARNGFGPGRSANHPEHRAAGIN
jgi:hypothetical protein